ncbi:hypothetical protein [Pandoraea apista]|uniref:hypothetical protein n=1 Tax=Pandoraea apista TaxID=93218 RepID=UPI002F928F14
MPASAPDQISPLVTWGLVVVGWVAVHYLTSVRERQKEIRELVGKLLETIASLERASVAFHSAPAFDQVKAYELTSTIASIRRRLTSQPLSKLQVSPDRILKLRRAVTLDNFDVKNFSSQAPTSPLIQGILAICEDVTISIEQAYARRYLLSWWQSFRI